MKIAVSTVHDSANFGSFLQAYALKDILIKEGHEVSFLITRDKEYVKKLYYNFVLSREALLHPIKTLKRYFNGRKKYLLFKKEQQCFSETTASELNKFDAVILGSDEIWNVRTKVFQNLCFYGKGVEKVIAYAVSTGLSTPEDFDNLSEIRECILRIKHPLVRDELTARCVEKITGVIPEIVCDPTLLADPGIYGKPLEDDYINKNRCLMLYMYEPDLKTRKIITDFAKKRKLKLVSVGFYYDWCDYNLLCSPLEFCAALKKAEYVITTTFHGTIFSIINNKKFVSIPLSPKTDDILKRLGAEDAALSFDTLTDEKLFKKLDGFSLDYSLINEKIKTMREDSLKKLKDRINEI